MEGIAVQDTLQEAMPTLTHLNKEKKNNLLNCLMIMAIFADKVIRHNPPLLGLPVHDLPVLHHDQTDHDTKPMKHWSTATVA